MFTDSCEFCSCCSFFVPTLSSPTLIPFHSVCNHRQTGWGMFQRSTPEWYHAHCWPGAGTKIRDRVFPSISGWSELNEKERQLFMDLDNAELRQRREEAEEKRRKRQESKKRGQEKERELWERQRSKPLSLGIGRIAHTPLQLKENCNACKKRMEKGRCEGLRWQKIRPDVTVCADAASQTTQWDAPSAAGGCGGQPPRGRDIAEFVANSPWTGKTRSWRLQKISALATALSHKDPHGPYEFTQEEWRGFDIHYLCMDMYVKSGDSYFKPDMPLKCDSCAGLIKEDQETKEGKKQCSICKFDFEHGELYYEHNQTAVCSWTRPAGRKYWTHAKCWRSRYVYTPEELFTIKGWSALNATEQQRFIDLENPEGTPVKSSGSKRKTKSTCKSDTPREKKPAAKKPKVPYIATARYSLHEISLVQCSLCHTLQFNTTRLERAFFLYVMSHSCHTTRQSFGADCTTHTHCAAQEYSRTAGAIARAT